MPSVIPFPKRRCPVTQFDVSGQRHFSSMCDECCQMTAKAYAIDITGPGRVTTVIRLGRDEDGDFVYAANVYWEH